MGKTARASIDFKNWMAGASSSPYSYDGGFSPASKGHNIDYQKGVIAPTNTATKVADFGAGYNGAFFSNENRGSYHLACSINAGADIQVDRYQATSLTGVGSDSTHNYSFTLGDIGYLNGYYYISSTEDIFLLSQVGGDDDVSWWDTTMAKSTLQTGYAHHFARLGNALYFTNGTYINKIISNASVVQFACAVGNTTVEDLICTTICEHSDKLYIGIEASENYADSGKGGYYLAAWDGNTGQLLDFKIPAPDKIISMVSYNGTLYCFTEKKLYSWNGLGFTPIRDLNYPVYKNQICKANGNLYFIGGNETTGANNLKSIQVFNGSAFYYLYTGADDIKSVANCFGDDLAFCSGEDLNKIDLNGRTGSGSFSALPIDFIENVFIRKMTVELAEVMGSGNVNTLKLYDQNGTLKDTKVVSYAVQGAVSAVTFRDMNIQNLDSLVIKGDTFNNLIRRITIEYEPTNQPY